jgi:hypothetical protein
MKQLKGHLYLVPTHPETTDDARANQKNRRFIAGLLGLSSVPEQWVKVCAVDENYNDEEGNIAEGKSYDWAHNGYFVDGSPGMLPFPDVLPVSLFTGKKERDVISFRYGDMEVILTLMQLPYEYGEFGMFEEVLDGFTTGEDTRGKEWAAPNATCTYKKAKHTMPVAAKVALGVIGTLVVIGICAAVGANYSNQQESIA